MPSSGVVVPGIMATRIYELVRFMFTIEALEDFEE